MKQQNQPVKETAQRILAAARDAFAEEGFSGTTVDAIARAAGVNKATLYYHIGGKDTLYAEVVRTTIEGTTERFLKDLERLRTPEEKLRRYIRTMAATVEENPWMPRIMMRELASGGVNLQDAAIQSFARVFTILGDILAEGARKGVFAETIPFLVHMMVMGALVFYKTSHPIRKRKPWAAEVAGKGREPNFSQIAAAVEALVLKAVRKDH